MPSFGVALAWIILSPLAFLINCLGVAFILHYRPLYHSCDVAFISIFITMATNSLLLLPIPAVVKLGDFYWSQDLCAFYIWLSITLRSAHNLVLLIINVYWMASLRLSSKKSLFTSATPMKLSVCFSWFVACIVGLVPASDTVNGFDFYTDNTCKFLPMSISRGYGIFFMIISLFSAVMGVISSLDTFLIFRSMKDVASSKYSADRFHVPTISGSLRPGSLIHAKYNELNVSLELCRLVLLLSIVSSVVNGIPLMASQFVQLIEGYNREAMETTLLWLLLIESLTVPHLLWAMSRRYRHAVVYTWRVFVLRDKSGVEEDTSDCTLQNFRLNVKGVTYRAHANGGASVQVNGHVHGIEDVNLDVTPNVNDMTSHSRANGNTHAIYAGRRVHGDDRSNEVVTDIEDGLAVMTHVTSPGVIVIHGNNPEGTTHPDITTQSKNITTLETPFTLETQNEQMNDNSVSLHSSGVTSSRSMGDNNLNATHNFVSPRKSIFVASNLNIDDVKNSTSTTSRQEWKDQMRKKHLPGVFLDNSLKNDPNRIPVETYIRRKNSVEFERPTDRKGGNNVSDSGNEIKIQSARNQTINDTTTYDQTKTKSLSNKSADYDFDFINDRLIRTQPHTAVKLTKMNRNYDDTDIGLVLDDIITGDNSLIETTTQEESQINLSPFSENNKIKLHTNASQEEIIGSTVNSSSSAPRNIDNSDKSDYGANLSIVNNKRAVHNDSGLENHLENPLPYSTDSDKTNSGNTAQSVTADLDISSGYPIILRTHYRKFLPYMDLVISNVDEAVQVDDKETLNVNDSANVAEISLRSNAPYVGNATLFNEQNIKQSVTAVNDRLTATQTSPNTTFVDESTISNSFTTSQPKETRLTTSVPKESASNISPTPAVPKEPASNISPPPVVLKESASSTFISQHVLPNEPQSKANNLQLETTAAAEYLPSGDYPQDYSQLETISGSEMLILKRKSVRSAIAINHSDGGTTSEEDGIDNVAYDDHSDDDSDDSSRIDSTSAVLESVIDRTIPDLKRRSTGSGRSSPSYSTLGNKSPEYMPERNYSGDGEESDYNSLTPNKDLKGFINYSYKNEPEDISMSHTSVTANITDPKLIDYQTLNYIHETDNQVTSHPLKRSLQSPHQINQISSTECNTTNSNISLFNHFIDNKIGPPSDSYLSSSYPVIHKPLSHFQMTPPDSGDSQRQNDEASPNVSPTKAGNSLTPVVKPPRQRRKSEDSPADIIQALENDSRSPREHTQLQNTHSSRSNSLNYMIPRVTEEDIAHISEVSSLSDTESIVSVDSVTIEPYGPRTPAWMSDLLLSSGNNEDMFHEIQSKSHQIPKSLNADEMSTNFASKPAQDVENKLNEYKFDTGETKFTSQNGINNTNTSSYKHQIPPVKYDFVNDSPEEYDNCVTIDYSDSSNYFRNRNLCFESIKEEPEDCLSDSASVMDQSDAHYVSRSSPTTQRKNIIVPPLEITRSPTKEKVEITLEQVIDNSLNSQKTTGNRHGSLPTSERTSADGSEADMETYFGNGHSGTHALSPTYTSTTATIKQQAEVIKQPTFDELNKGIHLTNSIHPVPLPDASDMTSSPSLRRDPHHHVKTNELYLNSDFHRQKTDQNAHSDKNTHSILETTSNKASLSDVPSEARSAQRRITTTSGIKKADDDIAYF